MLEDGLRVSAVIRKNGNSDARNREQFESFVADGIAQYRMTGLSDFHAYVLRARMANEDHEFIAAETRQDDRNFRGVKGGDCLLQLLRDDAKHFVADGVTEGIVDSLEAIEVEIDKGDCFVGRGGKRDQLSGGFQTSLAVR